MDIITLLGKIFRRLRVGDTVCKALLPFTKFISESGVQGCEDILYAMSPDTGMSCIRPCVAGAVVPEYDLQVIIPAYNAGRYIERCVDSVLRLPTRKKILVTVVNDGSTDDTCQKLRKYEGEERVEVILQPNKGFSGARNRGLETLRARYVTFLDSDDEFLGGGGIL